MGGNLFRGSTRRYELKEYMELYERMVPFLRKHFVSYNLCPHLGDKTSFGDMDIVVVKQGPAYYQFFKDLGVTQSHINGPYTSFVIDELQVDLISVTKEEFPFACFYYGNSDNGNFIGKLAHSIGCQFGHDGLWMPIRAGSTHLLGYVLLTRDPKVACEFLDVKYLPYMYNFDELFENIRSSKFFDPELFALENNNNVARVRDRKRPAYNEFLRRCEALKGQYPRRNNDKSTYHSMIFQEFPGALKEFHHLMNEQRLTDVFSQKLNGTIVREWVGLPMESGKELGEIMKRLKGVFNKYNTESMSKEDVRIAVMGILNRV